MATPRLNLTELTEAQTNAHITVNNALGIIEALVGGGAIDNDLLAEPGSPVDGDVYLLPSTGTLTGTDWATFANDDVAIYYQGWYAITPGAKNEGWTLYLQDENAEWRWDGSAWAVVTGGGGSSHVSVTAANATDFGDYIDGTGGKTKLNALDSIELTALIALPDISGMNPGVHINLGGFTHSGKIQLDNEGSYETTVLTNGTVDSSGEAKAAPNGTAYSPNHLADGNFLLLGVTFTGDNHVGGGNMLTCVANASPCHVTLRACHAEEAENDCISTKATSLALGLDSLLELTNCEANNSGSGASTDNCLTAHTGFRIVARHSHFHTPEYASVDALLVAGDVGGSETEIALYDCLCVGGKVQVHTIINSVVETADIANAKGISLMGTDAVALNNRVIGPATSGRGDAGIECDGSAAVNGATIRGNYVQDFDDSSDGTGIEVEDGTLGSVYVTDNTVVNGKRGYDFRNTSGTIVLAGNKSIGMTQYDVLQVSSTIDNHGGNHWELNAYSTFTPDVKDILGTPSGLMTDVELPMSQGNPAGLSATPALPEYIGDTDGKHLTLAFADGATNEMNFETVLPANYAGGGLTFELGWATTVTSLDGYWQIQIERMNVAITASSFAAVQEDIDTSNASASIPNTATITFTDGSQMDDAAAGDWIRVKVTRLGGHASDTLSAVANMLRLVMREQ